MKAIWNGKVIAESDDTIIIENNHYFPAKTINKDYFKDSKHYTTCYWKGEASYYHVEVDGKLNENAAWYYANPLEKAKDLNRMVAFWKGVEVID